MKWPIIVTLVLPLCSHNPIAGQTDPTAGTIELREDAPAQVILRALAFTTDLSADSVGIAGCSIERAIGSDNLDKLVRPALSHRFVPPRPPRFETHDCAVYHFTAPERVLVWIEQLVMERRDSNSILPYPERLGYELTIQVWRGNQYREWHAISLEPIVSLPVDGVIHVSDWRVTKYEVVGSQWH